MICNNDQYSPVSFSNSYLDEDKQKHTKKHAVPFVLDIYSLACVQLWSMVDIPSDPPLVKTYFHKHFYLFFIYNILNQLVQAK